MNGNTESSAQPPDTSQPSTSVPPHPPSTSQPISTSSLPPPSSRQPVAALPTIPPPSSRPPVASLPTPKTKPRHSIFSYMPPNPQLSHGGQGALPGQKKAHVFTSAITPQGHSENFPPKTGVPGGDSSAPQGVGVTAILSSELWDMSVIQTAPQAPLGTRGPRDQDKCPQQ